MSAATAVPAAPTADMPSADRQRTIARRIFRGTLAYTVAMTVFWLALVITGPEHVPFFDRYRVDLRGLVGVLIFFFFFTVAWGWVWYRIRALLLRRWAGFSNEEVREVFTSRMNAPFDLSRYLADHSERRIRIIDMIGRRGRFITLLSVGFWFIYAQLARDPKPEGLVFGAGQNLFDAVLFSWLNIAGYYSDGFFGRVVFGAQARLMDGILARANCLLIATLWNGFKFVMLPISVQLAALLPAATLAPLFGFIWMSYAAADTLSEVAGSLFGRQKIRVWGIGAVNRKSVEGTVAGFLGSLAVCLIMVAAWGLPAPWIGLAVVVSLSNSLLELFSPRGTDDFTMATANALWCWGFAVLFH